MSEAITADEAAAPADPSELLIELPAGMDGVAYARSVKIKEVKLKAMRDKPVLLGWVPREEIVQMNRFTRGIPDRYAIEYRRHVIRCGRRRAQP